VTNLLLILNLTALALLVGTVAVGLAGVLVGLAGRTVPVSVPRGPDATHSAVAGTAARLALMGVVAAAAVLLTSVMLRAAMVGHAPWSNLHEFSLAFAAVLLVVYLALARGTPIAALAPLAALLAAGIVGAGLSLDDSMDPLVPALQQPLLLTIHVGSAVVAYAIVGVAFVTAAAELVQRATGDRIAAMPRSSTLRLASHRAVLLGFPILTLAIALGALWANLAWRAYWSNDPKELAAAATWLVFGAYLHVANRRDRWGAMAPWLIVLGFAGVLFTYIGAGLFIVGEHSYGRP